MSHLGKGLTSNNFPQWNSTKQAWESTVESAYANLPSISSSGETLVLPGGANDWLSFVPTNWIFAKGGSSWQYSASNILVTGDPAPYIGKWMELEVKASAFISGFPATAPVISVAVAQLSDAVSSTTAYPKFEQRLHFAEPVTTNIMQFSFKNAIQYTHTGIRIYARNNTIYGGALNLNFLAAQMTIRPL